MQKCNSCGADLPENSRFCGRCGSVQDSIATDAAATSSNTPQPQPWAPEDGTLLATWSPFINAPAQSSAPAWSSNVQEPPTPPTLTPENEDEDELRRGIPPWSPLYGAALGGEALLGSGQVYTPGTPLVQGTPQIGSVPGVTGSPNSYTNAPMTHPMQGPGNASIGHPAQGPTNAPFSHPVQGPRHAPVTHPMQGPVHAPHPQPVPQPPELPGTPEQPPTHKHHRHHKEHEEHEHPQHQTHTARHELHRAARVTKVAGGSTVKTILIVVVAAAVVAAGGIVTASHFITRPQPLIANNLGTATTSAQVIPSPMPTSTPQAIFPQLKASYTGTAHNTTVNITDSLTLTSIKQNGQQISGYCTKGSKLIGSGPFTGTIDASGHVQLTVLDSKDSITTYFSGTLSNGILQGNYKVTYPFYPSDPNFPNPQYGIWLLS